MSGVLKKIVSGGQTGVDQGALLAAIDCGLEHGGWCPPGKRCETGIIPDQFDLKETPENLSSQGPEVPRSLRTEWNVRDSDATLVIWPLVNTVFDRGTLFALKMAKHYERSTKITNPAQDSGNSVISWVKDQTIEVLNVAGPSESFSQGIENQTRNYLRPIFLELIQSHK